MKTTMTAAALAAAAITLMAAPATAQTFSQPTFYGNLGYTYLDADDVNLGSVTGRAGIRLHPFVGAEAELSYGADSDKSTVAGVTSQTKLRESISAYGVAYLPINEKIELFARGGYGTNRVRVKTVVGAEARNIDSWNYGAGAQYLLDAKNGIRADYTRVDFREGYGAANSYSLSYVRKF